MFNCPKPTTLMIRFVGICFFLIIYFFVNNLSFGQRLFSELTPKFYLRSVEIDDLDSLRAGEILRLIYYCDKVVVKNTKKITAEQAKILKRTHGNLFLDGLEEIDQSIAEIFGEWGGSVSLTGLKKIDPEVFDYLSDSTGTFRLSCIDEHNFKNYTKTFLKEANISTYELSGVKSITFEMAKNISESDSGFVFSNATTIEKGSFYILNKKTHGVLYLDGLRNLSDDDFHQISKLNIPISINGIKSITDKNFADILRCKNSVDLFGLESINETQSKMLTASNAHILFKNLKSLNNDVALYTLKNFGNLYYPKVYTLNINKLSNYSGGADFHFDNLETLTDENAQIMGAINGLIYLPKLNQISDKAMSSLGNHIGELYLGLGPKIDERLSQNLVGYLGDLYFPNLIEINDKNAEHFSTCFGTLSIPNVGYLSDVQVENLSRPFKLKINQYQAFGLIKRFCWDWKSFLKFMLLVRRAIYNSGITSLNDRQWDLFSRSSLDLYFEGIKKISEKQSKILINHKGVLSLPGLKYIDERCLENLVLKTGDIYLDGIEYLSPKNIDLITTRKSDAGMLSFLSVWGLSNDDCRLLSDKQKCKLQLIGSNFSEEAREILRLNKNIIFYD